jgi:hypothetical protein
MVIVTVKHGYVVTDGDTYARTFLVSAYQSRRLCLGDAIKCAASRETPEPCRDDSELSTQFVKYLLYEL